LTARLALGEFRHREVAFDQVVEEVVAGRADAGVVIHEGQLTYAGSGLRMVLDLGEWWLLETGLPLPLGVNAVRRDVERVEELSAVLLDSIRVGLAHRDEAMRYALRFGRGIEHDVADRFVGMYVNDLTCDYGDEGRQAVAELLRRGEAIGAFPEPVRVDFVG
jgi:1,4-dihydroxy-6-naphthoate synthase